MPDKQRAQTFRGPVGFRDSIVRLRRRRKCTSITKTLIGVIAAAAALPPGTLQAVKTESPKRGGGTTIPGGFVEYSTLRAPPQTWEALEACAADMGVSRNIALLSIIAHFSK